MSLYLSLFKLYTLKRWVKHPSPPPPPPSLSFTTLHTICISGLKFYRDIKCLKCFRAMHFIYIKTIYYINRSIATKGDSTYSGY